MSGRVLLLSAAEGPDPVAIAEDYRGDGMLAVVTVSIVAGRYQTSLHWHQSVDWEPFTLGPWRCRSHERALAMHAAALEAVDAFLLRIISGELDPPPFVFSCDAREFAPPADL